MSKALQMPVRITRRDPRVGETVYRLTNLARTEPPADLFTVPSDYTVQDAPSPATFMLRWREATPAAPAP